MFVLMCVFMLVPVPLDGFENGESKGFCRLDAEFEGHTLFRSVLDEQIDVDSFIEHGVKRASTIEACVGEADPARLALRT